MGRYIIGITGASGIIYAEKLIGNMIENGHIVNICMTDTGRIVATHECGWSDSEDKMILEEWIAKKVSAKSDNIKVYSNDDICSDIASGSCDCDGMIVIPCTMGTLSGIAHGSSDNLLERAADVMLKERRHLLIVPREAPYNCIHLENMLSLARNGAVIMPASPGFYHQPKDMESLINGFVLRVMDQMGLRRPSPMRWTGL